jgi:hypothetical protein
VIISPTEKRNSALWWLNSARWCVVRHTLFTLVSRCRTNTVLDKSIVWKVIQDHLALLERAVQQLLDAQPPPDA